MAPWIASFGVVLLTTLAGCASPAPSSGRGAIPLTQEQRAKALKQAAAYCKKKGLVMRAGNAETPTRAAPSRSEVPFRCVKAG